MKANYKGFENKSCEYYPCHKSMEYINCLFCYCPLYSIMDCGGNYSLINVNGKQMKDCSLCTLIHEAEKGYDHVLKNYDKVTIQGGK